jgi:SAM-dependent methyltransferase
MFRKYTLNYALDDPRATLEHRDIILQKKFLKKLYTDWYKIFERTCEGFERGNYLEIGSGGGFIKEIYPKIITSDILELPNVDKVFSAEQIPFDKESLNGIMMLNVFHHIPNPHLFLSEAMRCLKKGGKVVMIEPANSVLGRFIYKRFHHEPFDEKAGRSIAPGHPLSNSNQALPYIYFERDLEVFARDYPQLKIKKVQYHSPFSYVISGGVSRSAMLPSALYPFVKGIEYLLRPISKQIGLFCTIELEKI